MDTIFNTYVKEMIDNSLTYNLSTKKFEIFDKNDERLTVAKQIVKDYNDGQKILYDKYGIRPEFVRISLMGRGPRRDWSKPYIGPYGRTRHPKFHYNADCNLQHKYAKSFDVYIHMDGNRTYRLMNRCDYV